MGWRPRGAGCAEERTAGASGRAGVAEGAGISGRSGRGSQAAIQSCPAPTLTSRLPARAATSPSKTESLVVRPLAHAAASRMRATRNDVPRASNDEPLSCGELRDVGAHRALAEREHLVRRLLYDCEISLVLDEQGRSRRELDARMRCGARDDPIARHDGDARRKGLLDVAVHRDGFAVHDFGHRDNRGGLDRNGPHRPARDEIERNRGRDRGQHRRTRRDATPRLRAHGPLDREDGERAVLGARRRGLRRGLREQFRCVLCVTRSHAHRSTPALQFASSGSP